MTKYHKKPSAFLLKTYEMLEKADFTEVLSWTDDGEGFIIKNQNQFAEKHNNLHSFIRQLNMYGFNKKRGFKTQNYYFHELFRQGQIEQVATIQRKVEKKLNKNKNEEIKSHASELSIQCESNQNNGVESDIFGKFDTLRRINNALLLEQIANLNQISQLISNCFLRSKFVDITNNYLRKQCQMSHEIAMNIGLIQARRVEEANEEKQKQNVDTTANIQEEKCSERKNICFASQ